MSAFAGVFAPDVTKLTFIGQFGAVARAINETGWGC